MAAEAESKQSERPTDSQDLQTVRGAVAAQPNAQAIYGEAGLDDRTTTLCYCPNRAPIDGGLD